MEKIIEWLKSCGYSESKAMTEANRMIEANRWDGVEMCSREYAIAMILDNLVKILSLMRQAEKGGFL